MFEYWKSKLSGNELRAYELLYSGAVKGDTQVNLGKINNSQSVQRAFEYLINDHPELYSIHFRLSMAISLFGGTAILGYIYNRADKMKIDVFLSNYKNQIRALSSLDSINAQLKVIERLVLETDYAIDNEKNQNAMSAIYFKKAQCSGYAKAFKLCMDELNIWCIVVNGTVTGNNGGPHTWNIIKLNGKYYHVDVTMMQGANMAKKQPLYYHMINCSDKKLESQGYVWDKSLTPPCVEDMDLSAYCAVPNGSFAPSQFSGRKENVFNRLYDLNGLILETLKSKKTSVRFTLDIPQYSAQKLSQLVQNVVQEKVNQLRIATEIQIKGCNKDFEIQINYR